LPRLYSCGSAARGCGVSRQCAWLLLRGDTCRAKSFGHASSYARQHQTHERLSTAKLVGSLCALTLCWLRAAVAKRRFLCCVRNSRVFKNARPANGFPLLLRRGRSETACDGRCRRGWNRSPRGVRLRFACHEHLDATSSIACPDCSRCPLRGGSTIAVVRDLCETSNSFGNGFSSLCGGLLVLWNLCTCSAEVAELAWPFRWMPRCACFAAGWARPLGQEAGLFSSQLRLGSV